MRLPAFTIAAATALTFAFPHIPVLAQGHDDGAVGRPLQLDGGSSVGSDNRGKNSARSEGTEQSASITSEKSQARSGKTGETAIRGRSQTRIGWRFRARHHLVMHKRHHRVFAFHVPRHRFVIHRHGRRFVALNETSGA
jgi:hypothetical protein